MEGTAALACRLGLRQKLTPRHLKLSDPAMARHFVRRLALCLGRHQRWRHAIGQLRVLALAHPHISPDRRIPPIHNLAHAVQAGHRVAESRLEIVLVVVCQGDMGIMNRGSGLTENETSAEAGGTRQHERTT